MRRILFLVIATGFLAPAWAADPPPAAPNPPEPGLKLLKDYRAKPDPQSVPALFRSLSERGLFKEPDNSGIYAGFYAGVLASNPRTAKSLIEKTLPLPFEDQWLLIRAVAYSRLPQWRALMLDLGQRLPERRKLVEYYLTGRMKTLNDVRLEPPRRTFLDKVGSVFEYETYFGKKNKDIPHELTFATNPELIDAHWGLYFATGKEGPLVRIIVLLPWTKERDDIDKLTIGHMAKFTLAANAANDALVLRALKRLRPEMTKDVRGMLDEVIEAAETVETGRIKKQALAALEDLRKNGPGSKRDLATWGQLGLTGLSTGCLYAATTGQVQFGVPCVVGGALTQATLKYFTNPE